MLSEDQKGYILEDISPEREEAGFELSNLSQLGGTEADELDMRMLGRTQQLNVRIHTTLQRSPLSEISLQLTSLLAEFSFYLDPGLCLHTDEYVGDCTDVCALQLLD